MTKFIIYLSMAILLGLNFIIESPAHAQKDLLCTCECICECSTCTIKVDWPGYDWDRCIGDLCTEKCEEACDEFSCGDLKYPSGGCNLTDTACSLEYLLYEDNPDLAVIRQYRDEVLSQSPVGQEIIRLYYEWSPAIVKAMEEDEAYKEEVKEMIDVVLELIGVKTKRGN